MALDSERAAGRIERLLAGHLEAQSLIIGRRLGLFECLDREPLAADALAQKLDLADHHGLVKLLTTLVGLGLVRRADERYELTESSRAALTPGSPEYFGDFIDFFADQFAMKPEADLRAHLQRGGPLRPAIAPEHWRHYMRAMTRMADLSATRIAHAMRLEHDATLLDLGGGPGSYAIACCEAAPQIAATIYDLPEALRFAEVNVRAAGLAHRIRLQPGSATDASFGGVYDVILLSHTIHLFAERQVAAMLRACHASLRPGGRLVLRDLFTDEARTAPLLGSLIAFHLWNEGDAYSVPQISRMLVDVGFDSPEPIEFRRPGDPEVLGSLVVARRPPVS